MSIKICHIADIHIRNVKYHSEYKKVFEDFYSILRKEKIDFIVICGDLAHTKCNLSSDYFSVASEFLNTLSNIAKTIVIPGNHDLLVSSPHRQDAISPIIETIDNPNLIMLKKTQEYKTEKGIVFNHYSILDKKDKWILSPANPDLINIALYHGPICGCETDAGWKMNYGDNDISIFDNMDYAFLGDIHKSNQILDKDGKIRYPGSLIQQNYGEENDKGFFLWEIESKNDFIVRHIKLINPKPFITVELTKYGKIPKNVVISKGSRVRLVANEYVPFDIIKQTIDVVNQKFYPESVIFLNRSLENNSIGDLVNKTTYENLRDPVVQKQLIEEYLKDYQVSKNVLDKVIKLNEKYNSIVEKDEEVIRNIHWEIKNFKWDNLFNYGKGNEIDFSKINGTIGILGRNFSGKSAIIDGMLYTIFNSISKRATKNLNIINQNKLSGNGKVELVIGNNTFVIKRSSEKYEKKLHGQSTIEASTIVDFYKIDNLTGEITSLNAESRTETDKRIRKMFGTIDDFLLMSLSSQFGSQIYINEGSTKRKEILAKFLDLDLFDNKFKLAKEDAQNVKGALKMLEGRNFDDELEQSKKQMLLGKNELISQKEKCNFLKQNIITINKEISELQIMINSNPTERINIDDVTKKLVSVKTDIENVILLNKELDKDNEIKNEKIKSINGFFSNILNIEDLRKEKRNIEQKEMEVKKLEWEYSQKNKEAENLFQRMEKLKEVPCGDQYPQCPFIKHAHEAREFFQETQKEISEIKQKIDDLHTEIKLLDKEKIEEYLKKQDILLEKKNSYLSIINSNNLQKQINENKILTNKQKIKDLQIKIKIYEDNKEVIENLEEIMSKKEKKEFELNEIINLLSICDKQILKCVKQYGSYEQRFNDTKEQKEKLYLYREEYEAYDLFLRCMHSDGISYDIVKKKLPFINNEISKILANIVDFEVFFENESRRLNIYIKHRNYDARPLELGSGAEKDIAAVAIRLALLNVSTLPRPDIIVLDEPGSSMDEENLEGFIRILGLMESYFKTVLVISHIDSLKDVVSSQINIEKDSNGYAKVVCKEK